MKLMPFRLETLEATLVGYAKTGVPLVAYVGGELQPAGFTDDPGIYYFVPELARRFGLSIEQAIPAFFGSLVLAALALSMIGSFLLFRSAWMRLIASLALGAQAYITYRLGDVYVMPAVTAMATVFPFLHFLRRDRGGMQTAAFLLAAGILLGMAHFVRVQSGTAPLMFMLFLIFLQARWTWKRKGILAVALGTGMLLSALFFQSVFARRDFYLKDVNPQYQSVAARHPAWHSLFLGLGYLQNDFGLRYADNSAIDRAEAVQPGVVFASPEYEAIVRGEYFRFLRTQPLFFFQTLFAKIGVALFYLMVFANVGLAAAIRYPKPWPLEVSFWVAMGFNSLYGILVLPTPYYLLGFIALCVLYGLLSIEHGLQGIRAGQKSVRLVPLEKKEMLAS